MLLCACCYGLFLSETRVNNQNMKLMSAGTRHFNLINSATNYIHYFRLTVKDVLVVGLIIDCRYGV